MAVKISSVSAVAKSNSKSADITNSILSSESEILNDITTATFNGEVVYVKDYCPLCHGVVTVVDRDGRIIATTYNGKGSTVDGSTGGKAVNNLLTSQATDIVNSRYKNLTAIIDIKGIVKHAVLGETGTDITITPNTVNTLNKVMDEYMSYKTYDKDRDGKIDSALIADKAKEVEWIDVVNKPEFNEDILVKLSETYHEHNNLNALSHININTVNNWPLWDGNLWPESNIAAEHIINGKYIRNIFTSGAKPTNANNGDVWFDVNTNNNLNGIYVKRDEENWYSLTIERITEYVVNKVIQAIMSGALSSFPHNMFSDLQGGDGDDQFYHIDANQYDKLKVLVERLANNEIAKAYDGLDSDSDIDALSAKKGKELSERIDQLEQQMNWLKLVK